MRVNVWTPFMSNKCGPAARRTHAAAVAAAKSFRFVRSIPVNEAVHSS